MKVSFAPRRQAAAAALAVIPSLRVLGLPRQAALDSDGRAPQPGAAIAASEDAASLRPPPPGGAAAAGPRVTECALAAAGDLEAALLQRSAP